MKRQQHGFGLMEAIVALVILGSSGFALFAWVGQSLADVRRTEDAQARAALQLSALALVANLNPHAEPKGERRVGDVRVQWSAELIEPLRYSLPFAGSQSPRWEVGLYRLHVVAVGASGQGRVEFDVEQAGLNPTFSAEPRLRDVQP